MEHRLIEFLLKYRNWLAVASIVLTMLVSAGALRLFFDGDYKVFFEETDPQRVAHEEIQGTYTKADNLSILVRPAEGDIFTPRVLTIIHQISEQGWQAPYVLRVDSLTNFQHTRADGDDLVVEDLLLEPAMLNAQKVADIRRIAMQEKQLVNYLVSQDQTATLINLTFELPSEVDPSASPDEQAKQRALRDGSHLEVVAFGRELIADFQAQHPDLEMHLTGVSVINNSFNESSANDIWLLIPFMYLVILVLLMVFLRSLGALIGSLILIAAASASALGLAGWVGYGLNPVNVMTPNIVLTIAVCDCVHLLVVYLKNLANKMTPDDAMRESFRLNLQPIVLTSVTTTVGFLTLNFASSPPFQQLGNMTAFGVMWAMLLTFTLLPAVVMLLVRKRKASKQSAGLLSLFARWVVRHRHATFAVSVLSALGLSAMLPLNYINDDPISYFKPGVEYRDASDFSSKYLPGLKDIAYSIACDDSSCTSDPEFLKMLDRFVLWLESDPNVVHVSSHSNTVKRLNRSMNGDQQAYFRIPDQADLIAQYNLMYEMSLPYGLDLNNQLNLDKSATKVTVLAKRITSSELLELAQRGDQWLADNYREAGLPAASVTLMFADVGETNIRSMLWGGVFAIIGVTLTILIALRSFKYALISMIPNSMPAFMAFGIWGLTVSEVNMAVAAVFSISLGILVDDTVHFISKYRRARLIKGLSPELSIEYAFNHVGSALIITTLVLAIGFFTLLLSDFNLNSTVGALTGMTIIIALIFDFLILPPILMMFDKEKSPSAS